MINRILIPTDGSEYGKAAIEYGIHLAEKLGAQITGLHVVDIRLLQPPLISDISGTMSLPLYHELIPSIESSLDERADSILQGFLERCREAGLKPELKKTLGVIEEKIIEEAKSADWIIMAQRGEHFRLGEVGILGSTAESVVHASGKPVMITPADFHPIKNMAFAYDGSPAAEKALKLTTGLAAHTGWPLQTIIITDNREVEESLSEKVKASLAPFNINNKFVILSGKEDKELIRFIRGGAVQLMVMGAYGHNKLRRLLLGSTTSYVIRKSIIPVLLTR
jgi:nucleotide-binding universal stress UspA family protein